MKVVIAPDRFADGAAGELTAVEAAAAIATGWRRGAPHDEVVMAPMSRGGTGFVAVMQAALGGELLAVTVSDLGGAPVPATVLRLGTDAYVECAQACGVHLLPATDRDIWRASTYGVGELVAAAVGAGARRVYVGLGGSATNDGGAGLLAALGAEPADALRAGPRGLTKLETLDLGPALDRVAGVELVAVTDTDNPLLGLRGASNVHAGKKGAAAAELADLDDALGRLAALAAEGASAAARGPRTPPPAEAKGSGAAGGLAYALLLLGGRRAPGFGTVAELTGLGGTFSGAELVVTGETTFDWRSMGGTVVSGVAAQCGEAGAPCVVLAGRVDVGRREMNANGVEAAYAVADLPPGGAHRAHGTAALALLAERTARNWSPAR